ncbi:MAG TPA: 5'-methylthioadenosine/S-adenosylhomocysteine nucleosidase [Terriglobales bacterium]|nr:5'-methylthioadenosine/S-adenosylhomocysteine nucleosidase [Terriglobales bacterium]
MTTLIVLPLRAELEALSTAMRADGLRVDEAQAGRLSLAVVPDLDASLAWGGHGKAQFALHTRHLLDHVGHVDLVVCAGAAGALADGIAVGDIVIATRTIEHDYQQRFSQPRRPAPTFEGDAGAIRKLREIIAGPGFAMHFGQVASGDEDIVSVERAQALRLATDALAVAWEGAGGARACAFSQTPCLEIRGVTDQATVDAPSHFDQNLGVAMRNIATLLGSWLRPR